MKRQLLFVVLFLLNTTIIFSQSKVKSGIINVTDTQFSDNASSYVNKTIRLSNWIFYCDSGNKGSYSDVAKLTLRMNSESFEDTYGLLNYNNSNKNFYCRTIRVDGNKITLLIPKSKSQNMPNTTSSNVIVVGKVIDINTIEVISIQRSDM